MEQSTFADLLATVESVIGERPKQSVLIATFSEDARLVATLVIELPEVIPDKKTMGIMPHHLMHMAGNLQQIEYECFAILAYVDREPDCEDHPAMFHQTQYIAGVLGLLTGKEPVCAGIITPEFFTEFDDDGPEDRDSDYKSADWKRHPVEEIDSSVRMLELKSRNLYSVFRAPLEPQFETPELLDSVRAIASGFPFLNNWTPGHGPGTKARELFERCIQRDFGPTEPEAIELLGYLQHPGIRDRLVADVLTTSDDLDIYVQALTGKLDIPLSYSRAENARSLFLNLTQYVGGQERMPLLLGLSILSWFMGSTHHAGKYAEILHEMAPKDKDVELWQSKLASASIARCATHRAKP